METGLLLLAVPLLQHKVLAFLVAWQTRYNKFLAFVCAGGVGYMKWFIVSLKLHRVELRVEFIDTTAKANASSLVGDESSGLERSLLFHTLPGLFRAHKSSD